MNGVTVPGDKGLAASPALLKKGGKVQEELEEEKLVLPPSLKLPPSRAVGLGHRSVLPIPHHSW